MKKAIVTLMSIMMMLIAVMGLAACGEKEDEPEKYDVAIRVGCSDGMVYEFPVGTDELHIEIPYDGVERKFGVRAYNLPDHPRWSDEWLAPSGEGANVFNSHQSIRNEGKWVPIEFVCERGLYLYDCYADSTSDIWNFRSIKLFINII